MIMGISKIFTGFEKDKEKELQKLNIDEARKTTTTPVVKESEGYEEPEEQERFRRYTITYKDKTRQNEVYDRVDEFERDEEFINLIYYDEDGDARQQHMIAIDEVLKIDFGYVAGLTERK